MNPRQFLLFIGAILIILSLAGMTVLGPTPDKSALGYFNWLDTTENIAHLLFGVVALIAYFFLRDLKLQRWLVAFYGVVALLTAVLGFLNATNLNPNIVISNLEISDDILNLVIALLAFYAAFLTEKSNA
jgi:hypothetical protein